jgi:glycosyltransferase involved in cell wall biosynthesis
VGLAGRDIVCLSNHYWDERWFRKQEFMSRLARNNRVLYVEPSYSMVRQPEAHLEEVATNRALRSRLERRGDGLYLLKPPRALPKWTHPTMHRLTYDWYGRVVARAVRKLGFRDPILWVFRESWEYGIGRIPHHGLIFDLIDDLAAYGGDDDPYAAAVERCVRGLAARSDLMVVTAKTLLDRYGPLARRIEHVPNGFDADRFSPARVDGRRPGTLAEIPRPIVGFIGTLFGFLDFELLEGLARTRPDWSLVLVGPIEANAAESVARLTRLENVTHIGSRPQAEIPEYVAAFDVCLNPFRRSRVADSVNPLKVYEYLAMGRPVVSTHMRALEMEDVGACVAFADGVDEWCERIDAALGEGPDAAARRLEAVAPYSWERLFRRVDRLAEIAVPN